MADATVLFGRNIRNFIHICQGQAVHYISSACDCLSLVICTITVFIPLKSERYALHTLCYVTSQYVKIAIYLESVTHDNLPPHVRGYNVD